jgi:hypothetical protein
MNTVDFDFIRGLSNSEAGHLFTYLLDRAVRVNPALRDDVKTDALIKAVCENLYLGKQYNLFASEQLIF